MIVSKKRFAITAVNILLLGIISWNMIVGWDTYIDADWCVSVSIVSLAIIIYQLVILKVFGYKYTDFVPWFVILSYIFLYGRIIVKALGHDQDVAWHLFAHFDDRIIYKGALFCLMYMQAVFTGMMLVRVNKELSGNNKIALKKEIEDNKYTSTCMAFIGWGVFISTIPIKLYCNLMTIVAQRIAGEYVVSGNFNGLLLALSYIPTVGLILIMCSQKYSKRTVRLIFLAYMLYEGIYMIFSGDRRQEVIGAIAMVLCYCKLNDIHLTIKKVISVCVAAFLGLAFLATIRTGRGAVISSMSSFLELFEIVSQNNMIIETLGEFGATFFTVVNGVTFYPDTINYGCGITYLAGLAIIIPGIMTELFPTLFEYGSVAGVCYKLNNLPTGGSLAEDMYCNFGFWGIVSTVLMGYILAYELRSINIEQSSRYSVSKYYILFFVLLNGVRSGFYELTRPLAYAFLLIWIFKKIYFKKTKI